MESLEKEIKILKETLRDKEEKLRQLKEIQEKRDPKILTNEEIARYSRQIILPEIRVKGQLQLKNSSVLIVGAGGLGCPSAIHLAGAGIGHLGILDYDTIEITNLHRQLLHSEENLGTSKVDSVKQAVHKLNSTVRVTTHNVLINSQNALEILQLYDLVIDATDNVATRYLLNDACVLLKKPLVSGSALQFEGQLTVYNLEDGPCYRCLFPKPPPPETVKNCGDGGVLGAITGVIGALQSLEAIKVLLGQTDNSLKGRLLLFDGSSCTFRSIKLRGKQKSCNVCGESPTILKLIDYEKFCGMAAMDKDPGLKILNPEDRISVKDYSEKISGWKHLLIDVRSPEEFEICQLANAINIPIKKVLDDKIEETLMKKIKDEDTSVFVVCRRGNDSQLAAQHLINITNKSIKDLIGGLHAWTHQVDSNFPIY